MNTYMICTLWTPFQAERDWKNSYREILLIPLYIFYSLCIYTYFVYYGVCLFVSYKSQNGCTNRAQILNCASQGKRKVYGWSKIKNFALKNIFYSFWKIRKIWVLQLLKTKIVTRKGGAKCPVSIVPYISLTFYSI